MLDYLTSRALLLGQSSPPEFVGNEADLLAEYIVNERSFDTFQNAKYGMSGEWDRLRTRPEYIAKREADRISYVWDRLIAQFHADYANDNMEFGGNLVEIDGVTRVMARENRFRRRMLGSAFMEFMEDDSIGARFVQSPSKVAYVFVKRPHNEDRKNRSAELTARCFVVRDTMTDGDTVLGIATEFYEKGRGFSLDGMLLYAPVWMDQARWRAREARENLGFFKAPRFTRRHDDEFPIVDAMVVGSSPK